MSHNGSLSQNLPEHALRHLHMDAVHRSVNELRHSDVACQTDELVGFVLRERLCCRQESTISWIAMVVAVIRSS